MVPVPRSAVTGSRPAPWPARDIADALVGRGFGSRVLPCLSRARAVPKAAWAPPGQRPTPAAHQGSLTFTEAVLAPSGVVLVDDVVTSGAQLLGAAWALLDAWPDIVVTGFAAVRTMSDGDVATMVAPVKGMISFDGVRTLRRP